MSVDNQTGSSSGWSTHGGKWTVRDDIEAYDHLTRTVYRSRSEPGFACWAVTWRDPGGAIKLSFVEVNGDPVLEPAYRFWSPIQESHPLDCHCKTLASRDGGRSWEDTGWSEPLDSLDGNSDHHWRAVVANRDGTLLRVMPRCVPGETDPCGAMHVYDPRLAEAAFPFEDRRPFLRAPKFPAFWRSADGGRTWSEVSLLRGPFSGFWPTDMIRLRDGALLTIGMMPPERNARVAVSESRDEALTWTLPQPLELLPDLFGDIAWCEENSMVELPDGKVLVVHRNAVPGNRRLSVISRGAQGWSVEDQWVSELPTGGHPHTRMASDGTIFYSGHKHGVYSSVDGGRSWTRQTHESIYYPQVVEAEPQRILTIGHSTGFEGMGDTCWPPPQEMEILASSFSYRHIEVLRQADGARGPCLAVRDDSRRTDFHAKVRIKLMDRAGIAFRVQDIPERGYYVAVMRFVDGPGRWREPTRSPSATILEVARIEGLKATTVLKRNVGKCVSGEWVELQACMSGNRITAAALLPGGSRPQYIGCTDKEFGSGRLGLFTHLSPAEFKGFELVDDSRMIRDAWS